MAESNDGKVVVQNVSLSLPPPGNYSFVSIEWETWLRRFGRFKIASWLCDKPGQAQVDTLMYIMGTQTEIIIENMHISQNQLADYEYVTKA